MAQFPLENTAPHSTVSEKKTTSTPHLSDSKGSLGLGVLFFAITLPTSFCGNFLFLFFVSLDHKLLEDRDSLSSLNPVSPGAQ